MDDGTLQFPLSLDDAALEQMRPMVTALVVTRLEALWQAARPHVEGEEPTPNAMIIQVGHRAIRDLAAIFKVGKGSPPGDEGPDPVMAVLRDRQQIAEQMRQLEARK